MPSAGDGGERPGGSGSPAEYARSPTGGPVAKAFTTNFARIYDRLREARTPPGTIYAADDFYRFAPPEAG